MLRSKVATVDLWISRSGYTLVLGRRHAAQGELASCHTLFYEPKLFLPQVILLVALTASAVTAISERTAVRKSWTLGGKAFSGTLEKTSTAALPGLCDTVQQTAGYFKIEGSKNAHYFYWHFESRNDPAKDPVIL